MHNWAAAVDTRRSPLSRSVASREPGVEGESLALRSRFCRTKMSREIRLRDPEAGAKNKQWGAPT